MAAWTTSCCIACARVSAGGAPDMDVYDAAAWSSVAGWYPVEPGKQTDGFPDFTRESAVEGPFQL
jgi:hypothetical protein